MSSGYTSWKTWALGVGMLASSDTGDGGCSGRVAAIARAKAKKERDAYAADLAHEGYTVRKFSNAGQLITRGGIGSGHPEISNVVTVYKVSYS